jgi:hypothetical protein
VNSPADAVRALGNEGLAGWETTGVSFTAQDKTTLLLKRLR